MNIRLDKLLADSGFGTRSDVKQLVRSGSVSVNGAICKDSGLKIDTDKDNVEVRGKQVDFSEFEYYMLYKPAGIITASRDKKEKTVLDLIESKKRRDLFPVGRLDRDTEGLLLITNDGELSHKLLSPGKHVDKKYIVFITGNPPEDIAEQFKNGVDIGDEKPTKPAILKTYNNIDSLKNTYGETILSDYALECIQNAESDISIYDITITEGRYHEIKRMFEAVDCKVIYLMRYSMGNLTLDPTLNPGNYTKIHRDFIN